MIGLPAYVYAIVDADRGRELPPVPGIDGAPLAAVLGEGIAAVVSEVDPTEFSTESLQRNLEDIGWLERTARAHHGVVDALADRGPVAPLRLATVYLDEGNLRSLLTENRDRFAAVLDRVRGRREWGVKAFAPARQAAPEPTTTTGGPGMNYLKRRAAERTDSARGLREADERAAALHAELSRLAVDSRSYPAQDPRLSGHTEPMVLNAAYLVDDDGEAALLELVRATEQGGSVVELTGPWAPYSFTGTDDL
jgi:hypothetical protein